MEPCPDHAPHDRCPSECHRLCDQQYVEVYTALLALVRATEEVPELISQVGDGAEQPDGLLDIIEEILMARAWAQEILGPNKESDDG